MERKETSKKKTEGTEGTESTQATIAATLRHREVIRFTCPNGTRTEILRERIAQPLFSHSHHHPEKRVRNCIVGKHKKWQLIRWWRAAWSTGGVKLHSFEFWGTERAESKNMSWLWLAPAS